MRVRTVLTLTTGAACGAGGMYLLDPEHGQRRRRAARREAVHRLRASSTHAAVDARRRATEVAVAAVTGYREARSVPGAEAPTVPVA